MCRLEVDPVHSKKLWYEVADWILELGMNDYNLTERKIVVGDLESALAIISVILYTKKVIYSCTKKEQKQNIQLVKNDIRNIYFQEKYRYYI